MSRIFKNTFLFICSEIFVDFDLMACMVIYSLLLSLHFKSLNETVFWKNIVNTINSFEMTAIIH